MTAHKKWRLILLILAILPWTLTLKYLGDSVTEMMQAQQSYDYSADLSWERLHFYLKRRLKREWQQMSASELDSNSELTTFYITIADSELERLNRDLPRSGRVNEVSGTLRMSDSEQQHQIAIRYRGMMQNHWFNLQKSLRIKLRPFESYRGEQVFNLLNPTDITTCLDCVTYDLARSVGLLTPDFYPVRVVLNGEYMGVYNYLTQTDESMLRKQRRMPGSIYNGDSLYGEVLIDGELRYSQYTVNDKTGETYLWRDPLMWNKVAARNREQKAEREDIIRFLQILSEEEPLKFYAGFNRLFDKHKFYQQIAIDQYFGSHHRDKVHNHKIYFDPYKGRFEPIAWDVRFWRRIATKDGASYPLLDQIRTNPILEYERDLVTQQLLTDYPVTETAQWLQQYGDKVDADLAADPHRDTPHSHAYLKGDYSIPFSMAEFQTSIKEKQDELRLRVADVAAVLDYTDVAYMVERQTDTQAQIIFRVTGNSPVVIDLEALLPASIDVSSERISAPNAALDAPLKLARGRSETLYPGRIKVVAPIQQNSELGKQLGNYYYQPAPLYYRYLLSASKPFELPEQIEALNGVTGGTITIAPSEFELDAESDSIHPWVLLPEPVEAQQLFWSGEVVSEGVQEFGPNTSVTIAPGTRIRMGKGASLVFYGPLFAEGSVVDPITILRKDEASVWGAIVLQGGAASGSRLRHIDISGGSVLSHQLVHYPGQLNIHDVADFELSDSLIRGNSVGDDNLHIAYSSGKLERLVVYRSLMDAVDIDISEVTVRNSLIMVSGNDGIDMMSSNIVLNQVAIMDSGDKCLSVGEGSELDASQMLLQRCHLVMAIKDGSRAQIESSVIIEPKQQPAALLYNKNALYSVGGELIIGQQGGLDESMIEADRRSSWSYANKSAQPISPPARQDFSTLIAATEQKFGVELRFGHE